MKKILSLVLFILSVGCASAQQQYYHMIWQDEFDGQGHPDSSRWNYETGGDGWGNNELQYYTERRLENARLENGRLIIEAHKEYYQGNDYTSARLTTKNKGDWAYGRIEARAKLPAGRGTWPAIWMLPTQWIYGDGSWPDNGEIDIMEHVGYDEGIIHGTIHTNAYNHMDGTDKGGTTGVPDATENFHIYAIEWTASEIRWYVDDHLYFTFENKEEGWQKWPFDHPFHLLMNIAVGGDWGGVEGVDDSIFPVQMQVDYVRVYQTADQIGELIEGPGHLVSRQKGVSFSTPIKDAQSYQWSVPEDAEINGASDQRQVTVDWGCQSGEVACTIVTADSVYDATHSVALEQVQIDGPRFYNEDDDPLSFSVPEMVQTTYQWELPEGGSFVSGEGTHVVEVDWPERADSITLNITNDCGTQIITHQLWTPGQQFPYPDPQKPHLLPDTIDPTHYDYGGEGVAYHDVTSANEGSGIRQDEGVDTESLDRGYGNIGYIKPGEWVEYSIKVEKEFSARVVLRMASAVTTNGSVDVLVNGETVASDIQARNTGEWYLFEEFESNTFTLSPQDTLLRLEFDRFNFNVGRIIVKQVETAVDQPLKAPSLNLYPNPARETLNIVCERDMERLEIYDLTGSLMQSKNLTATSRNHKLNLRTLPPGMYLLRVGLTNQRSITQKIIKE